MKIKYLTYNHDYKEKIISFLISICIDEFNHYNWMDYLKNKDFSPYTLNDSLFLIALHNNEIIGSIGALKVNKDTIKINSFYVKKEYRNKKIGTSLYNKIINFIENNNYKEIILCTYDSYNVASIFYKKNNFILYKIDGEEKWMKKQLERKIYENK